MKIYYEKKVFPMLIEFQNGNPLNLLKYSPLSHEITGSPYFCLKINPRGKRAVRSFGCVQVDVLPVASRHDESARKCSCLLNALIVMSHRRVYFFFDNDWKQIMIIQEFPVFLGIWLYLVFWIENRWPKLWSGSFEVSSNSEYTEVLYLQSWR